MMMMMKRSTPTEPARILLYQERGAPSANPFYFKLTGDEGQSLARMKAVLIAGEKRGDSQSDAEGYVELDLSLLAETLSGELWIFRNANDTAPSYFEIHIAYLDPVDTPSGIQSRCNLLGFDCGAVDGHLGDATQRALRAFQTYAGLIVDGEAGPKTQAELSRACGL